MVTTIQVHERVKLALDRIKSPKETYEEVILNLMNAVESQKRKEQDLLIEGCKALAQENKKITREFERIEELKNWEW